MADEKTHGHVQANVAVGIGGNSDGGFVGPLGRGAYSVQTRLSFHVKIAVRHRASDWLSIELHGRLDGGAHGARTIDPNPAISVGGWRNGGAIFGIFDPGCATDQESKQRCCTEKNEEGAGAFDGFHRFIGVDLLMDE